MVKTVRDSSISYDNGIIRYGSVSRLLTLSDGDFIDLIMTKSGFVLNDPEEKVKYVIEYLLEEINNSDLKKFTGAPWFCYTCERILLIPMTVLSHGNVELGSKQHFFI